MSNEETMKQPLRLTIASVLMDGVPRTSDELAAFLRPSYPGERQINPENLDNQVQALRAVGIVSVVEEHIDQRGQLVQTYTLTDYGREKVKRAQ